MNFENQFSFKELYDVKIKSTYNRKINDRDYEEGETIWSFDKLQISNLDEIKKHFSAKGGFDNRSHVTWDSTEQININFTQGIFSIFEFALFSNGKFKDVKENTLILTQREKLETDEDCTVTLKFKPHNKVFAYRVDTGEKLSFSIEDNKVIFTEKYMDVLIDYNFIYQNEGKEIVIGEEVVSGYLELEGRTKLKDDETGLVHTGIIKIPRLKLMSKLSIRVGSAAHPVVGTFSAIALPIGVKGNTKVMEFISLDKDLDSDI